MLLLFHLQEVGEPIQQQSPGESSPEPGPGPGPAAAEPDTCPVIDPRLRPLSPVACLRRNDPVPLEAD